MALQTASPPLPASVAEDGEHAPGRASPPPRALAAGTRLRDYELRGKLAEGTCSIVYEAWDHALQRKVAVKEYLPTSIAARAAGGPGVVVAAERHFETFKAGLRSFVNEARMLARFDHPSLAKVYRFWEENATAYMVMPFYEGPTLQAALAELGHVPSEGELRTWLRPVLDAVAVLHQGKVWHEGIAPDAILLTPTGPVLLGFAAAKRAIAGLEHEPAAALAAGFAAVEQYVDASVAPRGPWTDLYSLAAVVYAAITLEDPQPAIDRQRDDRVRPLSAVAAGLFGAPFLAAIDAAMAVPPERRPQDHLGFRALMGDIEAPERLELAPRRDLMQEPFLGGIATDREITVPDRMVSVPAPLEPRRPVEPPRQKAGADREAGARAPSWFVGEGRGGTGFGNRALYGIVAVTFAFIGLAALGLQFYSRQSARAVAVPAGPVVAGDAAKPAAAPMATPRPTPTVAAGTPPVPSPAAAPTVAATPAPTATPTVSPAPPAATTAGAIPPAATGPQPPAAALPTVGSTPMSPAERQTRCLDILQKASLEPITAAETAFFKRECR